MTVKIYWFLCAEAGVTTVQKPASKPANPERERLRSSAAVSDCVLVEGGAAQSDTVYVELVRMPGILMVLVYMQLYKQEQESQSSMG